MSLSRIFKACILSADGSQETIAIKPCIKKFESFKEEIFIRLPELKNKNFKIFYHDHDGDKITIFNTLDFEIFYDLMIQKVFVVISDGNSYDQIRFIPTSEQEQAPQTSSTTGHAAPINAAAAAVHHTNVICDQCENEIVGYRYKCLQCRDYDLCMHCEAKLSHQEHAMIRIPDSSDFCLGSRLAKRLRLRRSDCSTSRTEDSATEGKKHHGHHRRHSSSHRQSGTLQDIISQCVQSLTNVAAPVANATATAASAPPQPGNAQPQNPTDIPMHCKNAEKYAKASIDLLSNLAQNFTTMMDPFASSFAYEENLRAPKSAQTPSQPQWPSAWPAAPSSAAPPSSVPLAPTPKTTTIQTATPAAATEKQTEKPPAEKKQEKALQEQQPNETSIEQPKETSIEQPKEPSIEQPTEIASSSNSPVSSVIIEAPLAAAPESISSNKSSDGQQKSDWTLLDVDDLADELQNASKIIATASAAANSSTNSGAVPKAVSFEDKDKEPKQQPDYEELSRALRSHIEEFQQIFKNTGKEEAKSKKSQTPPSTPVAQQPRHPDPRVNDSLVAMLAMGFSNEGGWLTQLLESVEGNIPRALDLLQPQK